MRRSIFVLLAFLGSFFFPFCIKAAHFENLVDLTVKVEDASFNLRIKNVKFNNQDIKLDDPDMLKPRKTAQYKLPPGRYMLNWSTEKGGAVWGNASPITEHERIVVLESGDVSVKINIKGDTVSLY